MYQIYTLKHFNNELTEMAWKVPSEKKQNNRVFLDGLGICIHILKSASFYK